MFDKSVRKLVDYLPPVDAAAIRACTKTIMRFHNPKRGTDIFLPALCGNYYCVRCPAFQHHSRVFYHARKIASLDPTEDQPVPKLVNLVFTLPPQLHSWARTDSRFFPAFRRAILRTIGEAYGYEGKKGYPVDRAAFKELGAIMNFHAIGDEGTPWPKWAPHHDIIMPAWKRDGEKLEPLRTTWPERYSKTNRRYAENLRHCLLPLTKRPNLLLHLATFLESDFQTDWHVSRPPKTDSNPDRKGIIHVESAMHRIRYSCRPLFLLGSSKLKEEDGRMILTYRVDKAKGKGQLIHRVPLGPALSQIESLREWMWGRATRSWAGILSRTSYDEAAKLAGHEPVRPKEKKGFVLKTAYELGAHKQYIIDDTGRAARAASSLGRNDREDDA